MQHECNSLFEWIINSLPSQTYRHVDNVMFDDGSVVDRFIEGWRRSGQQRIGYLIGQYKEYSDVPLGIRAVVSAIYEPPQVSLMITSSAEIYLDGGEHWDSPSLEFLKSWAYLTPPSPSPSEEPAFDHLVLFV